jgi:hypothetical protein
MRPFLRAYLAGIALPTMVIPAVIVALALSHAGGRDANLERVVIVPVGLAPNAWGLWNMFYLRLRRSREVPIGLFGAALVLLLAPAGYWVQTALGQMVWTRDLFLIGFPAALALYYLAWKHLVARLNDLLGIG